MHAPLLYHGESAFPIACKQSRQLVHLQQLPKQTWCTQPPAPVCTDKPASVYSTSAGATLLSQPAMREDCTREQTKMILAGMCCKDGIAAWSGLSNPQEERKEDSEGQVAWCTLPGDLVHVYMQRTHCTCAGTLDPLHHDEECSVQPQISSILFSCLTLLLPSQTCTSISPQPHLFFFSPALFYPIQHFFASIYLLLCCVVDLKESA